MEQLNFCDEATVPTSWSKPKKGIGKIYPGENKKSYRLPFLFYFYKMKRSRFDHREIKVLFYDGPKSTKETKMIAINMIYFWGAKFSGASLRRQEKKWPPRMNYWYEKMSRVLWWRVKRWNNICDEVINMFIEWCNGKRLCLMESGYPQFTKMGENKSTRTLMIPEH